ncbi:MAG: hypothetical protein AVDCRST_MAG71-1230 [uncultured Lysobacter sp.]|uniref:Uncharacterized protein n=1 Tax=uncultured Lysobacter sp. TaxID=271060 RepID=A0A6J4L1C1_9GAMM|nr:MAG: hypothetical protein AVDCRST_MAG71-1230 [uncultured Lysobacter sp.]
MRLNVYVRSDDALVVFPDLFKPPAGLESECPLRMAGWIDAERVPLSDALVEQMVSTGYGVASGRDAVIFRSALLEGEDIAASV